MAICNVEEILQDGACFACLTEKQLQVIQAQLLCDILAAGGGGGAGAVAACGENYAITGTAPNQSFKFKNSDTGLANRVSSVGVDGVQSLEVDTGTVSC